MGFGTAGAADATMNRLFSLSLEAIGADRLGIINAMMAIVVKERCMVKMMS